MTGPGDEDAGGEELEELTPREVIDAFCDLDPAAAWEALRAVAADVFEPEDRRVRAAAWLAIANAVSALQPEDQD